jgi:hypothetical protein
MKVEKINNDNKMMVIELLNNVNGLSIEKHILDNCHVLFNDLEDIVGTISYEKYDKLVIVRYFVFKRNVTNDELLYLYNSLENELQKNKIDNVVAIINSDEVREVFGYLGFKKIDKNKVYFDETVFTKTHYKNNDVYLKKCNNNFLY